MSWVAVFTALLVSHLVGDYLLQTDWQARHKRGGLGADPLARRALSGHVATYTLAFVPALAWIGGEETPWLAVLAAALVGLPHLVIDDGRVIASYVRRVKRADRADPGLAGAVDQSFHVLSLWVVAIVVDAL